MVDPVCLIHSANLCLVVGEFNPLIFKVNINRQGFATAVLLIVFGLLLPFSVFLCDLMIFCSDML
jgi:hypothetical protein